MQLRVLGPVEVAGGGRTASLGSERRRTVLAVLLAARGAVVSTDRLIDAVWEARPPPSAHKSLRSHLSRLRAELAAVEPSGGDAVVTAVDGYRVDLAGCEVDAIRFDDLVTQAQAVLPSDPATAEQLLGEALGLWRGPAFGELAAHSLVRSEAVRLEERWATAAADRVDARLALRRHADVIGDLEARLAPDALDERAHGQLMLALYRSGRQAEALATYRSVHERLREQLGVDPSPALQALHARMLRQDADLDAPAPPATDRPDRREVRAARTGGPPTPPAGSADLIGRADEVESLCSLVVEAPLTTLTGPGGVGKTRLAEHVAARATDAFDDGVATVTLASVRDPGSVGAVLLSTLGLPQPSAGVEGTLVSTLGTRRLLLVLDNCEHVAGSVSELVETLLRRCPNLAVLATSREPLRLSGERVWQVAPLPVPRPAASADEVVKSSAGALFGARAAAAAPGFELTDANAPAVAELCRRLDGMPLAIELAAARARALAPADLLERLSDRFELLTGGPRHEGGRHRTLQAVVAWSHDLLDRDEARLFQRLSVFAGPFPLEAAERVCAGGDLDVRAVAGVLAELVDKSMVSVERAGESVRYRLLDTLRQFATERLAEAGATEGLCRAHADYHVALAEQLGPQVRGPGERAAVAGIDAVTDDLRVAHEWLVAAGDVDGALRLPVALGDYLILRLRDEMVTWTERALQLPAAAAHPAYATALAIAAMGATSRDQLEAARRRAASALDAGGTDGLATLWALDALRIAALFEGRLDDVLAFDDRMAAAAEGLGEDYYRAFVGVERVLALLYRGDGDAASAHAARLEQAAESSGNPTVRAWAAYCQGEALMDRDPAEAERRLEAAVEIGRSVGSLPEGVALVSLASLCGRHGDTNRALGLFREVIGHWRRLGDYGHQLTALRNLVELLARIAPTVPSRVRADPAAAVLHGAVSAASTPSFGAEAERLAAAWDELEQRLGADAAATAADRGRRLTAPEMVDEALAALDRLLDG